MATTVLVTGATGCVGLHLVERLLAAGARVVGVSQHEPDALARRFLAGVPPAATFVCGDVRDRDLLLAISRREHADRFVHAAAITPSPEVERASPAAVVDVNLTGTVAVLEAARECRARRVVLLSSSGLYGPPDAADRLVTEDAPLQISGLYSICKLAGEHIGRRYATPYGLSVIAARVGTVYGPMERPMPSRQGMSEVYALMHAAIHNTPVSVFGAACAGTSATPTTSGRCSPGSRSPARSPGTPTMSARAPRTRCGTWPRRWRSGSRALHGGR